MNVEHSILNKNQIEDLESLLICLIPKVGLMPSATEVDVIGFLQKLMFEQPSFKNHIFVILEEIKNICSSQEKSFDKILCQEQISIIKQVEIQLPDSFQELLKQTYNAYYTNTTVLKLIDGQEHPPQPIGHDLTEGDFSLLDAVKARGDIWRDIV